MDGFLMFLVFMVAFVWGVIIGSGIGDSKEECDKAGHFTSHNDVYVCHKMEEIK